jgi:archaellum component FlaF (FlaF/FlaG flagellin family)
VNQFKESLIDYIDRVENGDFSAPNKGNRRGQIDPETRIKIETAAIETAVEFYIQRGYDIQDRQLDNVGYDLEATKANETLLVEVKGTSVELPSNVNVILTPNEYKVSKKSRTKYRICIVINALNTPELFEFLWDSKRNSWFSEQSLSSLKIVESIAANLYII